MAQIRIKVNRHLCSGCLSCMTVCSVANESYASLTGARVQVHVNPFEGVNDVVICRECSKAACVEACSQDALVYTPEGYLVIDYERCNECRDCVEACPFGAIFWNPISAKIVKCEQCHGDPQCVQVCPTGALAIREVRVKSGA